MESFSLLNLINSIKDWVIYLLSNLKGIIIITSVFLSLVLLYNFIKSPIHYARTTFVLDSESSSNSIGDIASLASLAGINQHVSEQSCSQSNESSAVHTGLSEK